MRRTVPIVVALLALQAVLVLLFVAPARDPQPHRLPVGVVGSAPAPRGDAFDVHRYPDADAARAAIREREVYGAVVPAEGRVLVASAASPVVAQQLGQQLGGAAGANGVHVEDVVPIASGDPRGAALNLLFLPLMIACFPLAALLGRMRLPRRRSLGIVVSFSVLSGLALTALLRAMDALPGPYLAVAGVAALVVAAVALTATGLFRVLGPAGLGIAAVLFVVLGNPGSGQRDRAGAAPRLLARRGPAPPAGRRRPGAARRRLLRRPRPARAGARARRLGDPRRRADPHPRAHAAPHPHVRAGAADRGAGMTPETPNPELFGLRPNNCRTQPQAGAGGGGKRAVPRRGARRHRRPDPLPAHRLGRRPLPARNPDRRRRPHARRRRRPAQRLRAVRARGPGHAGADSAHGAAGGRGLYRHVRNPMYLAVTATILGQWLLLARPVLLAWALVFAATTYAFVRGYEEPTLLARYGEEYERYRAAVPGWWPRRIEKT